MAAIHPARATLKYSALVLAALGLVQPAARAGLVGHWALDETGGTTAACDVNVTYNGTIAGATIDQSGKIGKAFGFGGSGYVDVNAAPWSGTMTVSAWINTTTG
ncbi:MAG: hypothetical protein NTW21_07240, partial [Verrucomicrobia bacterium]|nr:hypothetical protein [Verrucomicrobiota bacterium]